jgi:hypothetical protein
VCLSHPKSTFSRSTTHPHSLSPLYSFLNRPVYEGLPVSNSYASAKKLLEQFNDVLIVKEDQDNKTNTSNCDDKKWSVSIHVQEEIYNLLPTLLSLWNSTRVRHALPTTYQDAELVMKHNGDFGVLYQEQSQRSVAWLQDHGICMDHIQSGPSTLEHAGSGAFAKRFLPKGTLIAASPLHHMFRNFTDMYEFKTTTNDGLGENQAKEDDDTVNWHILNEPVQRAGQQLLLNYCFGRPHESTLLLCPYGPGVNYINHNQTLANVKVQWAPNGTSSHNSTWLSMVPNEMA